MAASSTDAAAEKRKLLFCLYLYKCTEGTPHKAIEVAVAVDVNPFPYFKRGTIKEFIKFHARTIMERTESGKRLSVQLEQNMGQAHAWVHPSGLGGCVLSGPDYPMRVAYQLISEVIRIFLEKMPGKWENVTADVDLAAQIPEMEALFKKFQNPEEADKITKIEKDLDDVKCVVVQSMEDILKRGENLESLMAKSNDLSASSTQFYRTAKKNNQCCQWY